MSVSIKLAVFLLILIFHQVYAGETSSSFARVSFGDFMAVDLPRDWTYMDKNLASHLNTSSEARLKMSGINTNQGDNNILVAANAYDSFGHSNATLRISVRRSETLSQMQMQELSKRSPEEINSLLMPIANETITVMLKNPDVKFFKLRSLKFVEGRSLVCYQTSFDGDFGHGAVIANTVICPLGDKTLKLSTSYHKEESSVYEPTIEWVWKSLQISSNKK